MSAPSKAGNQYQQGSEKHYELCNCRIRKDRSGPRPRIRPQNHRRDRRESPAPRGVGTGGSGDWTHGRRQVAAGCTRGRHNHPGGPVWEHREVAKALPRWEGKTVIDTTNAFGVPPEELGGTLSSAFVAKAFSGAKLVKGFNHLGAAILATDPIVEGGHRVVFLSSDDEDAIAPVEDLAQQLGCAPVKLGKFNEGGALVHARGRTWGQLIFQDLFKKQQ